MNQHRRGILFRLYRHGKGQLNYLLDRFIDLCDMVLMDAYRLPWPIAHNAAKKIARYIGYRADFDHFHYHMYRPHLKARHGQMALTARYQDQWQRWFVRGGLVLVTQYDKPVAGVLYYTANDTCFDIERGVLEADPQLFKQGIETIITWYAITWGRDQGAKIYDNLMKLTSISTPQQAVTSPLLTSSPMTVTK